MQRDIADLREEAVGLNGGSNIGALQGDLEAVETEVVKAVAPLLSAGDESLGGMAMELESLFVQGSSVDANPHHRSEVFKESNGFGPIGARPDVAGVDSGSRRAGFQGLPENGFKCGGVDFVTRPFRAQELLARTRTHIELKKAKEKLLMMAVTDELTGLFNRRYFMNRLNQEFERVKRYESAFTFIMIDIDHFKRINDIHGHLAGDSALKNAADILKKALRLTDTVGRIGGEEFAILLPETEIDHGVEIAERLRRKIDESELRYESAKLKLTISAGISDSVLSDETADSILKRADTALYRAKEEGRNRVFSVSAAQRDNAGK